MPFNIGPTQIILVVVIILVLFGMGKLPQVGSALGKTMRVFRTGRADDIDDDDYDYDDETPPARKRNIKQIGKSDN
ncbi:MAG: twin-arginine translocase TatA/TatE family subunit [Dehalococcoidia bacterium]|nr:twin-arginine translocase TatA/TatE family subunit [Dehalococcoidia bacterium]